jgi:tetratricopeptide (TPR) repeat protein
MLTSVILSLSLSLLAEAQEKGPLEVYARGDYAGAVEMLEPKYRAEKTNIQERIILARAYLHLERADEALEVLKSVLNIDPENPEANGLAGRIHLKRDSATAGTLGACYYELREFTKARVYLEKALSEDIRDPRNSFILGKICLERGFGALAEKNLLRAEEAGMVSSELYLLLSRSYLLQRKYVGPILVRRLSEPAKAGDIVDDYVVLGGIEGVPNQYRVCTRHCVLYEGYRLLQAEPNNIDARYLLARGWLAAGNKDLAEGNLSALLEREKDTFRVAELQIQLQLAKREYGSLERTLDAAKEAGLFDPQRTAEFYYQAAMMLRVAGNRKEAIRLLSKAESYAPTSAPILRALAGLHLGLGHRSEARGYYARLVELFPDAADIDELRNRVRVLEEQTRTER